jgi:predicted nucleic acid-binding protein
VSSIAVVLDADVLFSATIRDTLLRAAAAGLYRLYFSHDILREVQRNLSATGRADPQQARRLVNTIGDHFPESLVTGYEVLIDAMTNDPKDRHVLAAAVVSGSQVIVTNNSKHFPAASLEPFGIEAWSPDNFLTYLFDLYPEVMAHVFMEQIEDLRSPSMTYNELLSRLGRQAPGFAALLRREFDKRSEIG